MDERQDPRARLRPVGAEPRRAPPHREKPLLHRVLGELLVAEDADGEAEGDASYPVVELAERVLVTPCDERHERLVRQVSVLLAHGPTPAGGRTLARLRMPIPRPLFVQTLPFGSSFQASNRPAAGCE